MVLRAGAVRQVAGALACSPEQGLPVTSRGPPALPRTHFTADESRGGSSVMKAA